MNHSVISGKIINTLTAVTAVLLLTFFFMPVKASAAIEINSDYAVVIDVETGQILYGKSPYTLAPCGDFDKMLNIVTALDFDNAPEELVVTANALKTNPDPPYLGLKAGQIVSLNDMLFAEYLGGYNDAANVVAENLGQLLLDTTSADYAAMSDYKKTQAAIEAYVKKMNGTASKLLASSMKATNSDGHFYDTQQCSPVDMARLIQNFYENKAFRALLASGEQVIAVDPANINSRQADYKDKMKKKEQGTSAETSAVEEDEEEAEEDPDAEEDTEDTEDTASTPTSAAAAVTAKTTIKTTNKLLDGSILYSGIKGGYNAYNSNVEKYHMMVCAENEERTLVAVAMNGDENIVSDDIQALLNFGFYKWHKETIKKSDLNALLASKIAGGGENLAYTGNFDILLPDDYDIYDLDAAIAYTENTYLSGTVTLSLPEEVSYAGPVTIISFYEKNERNIGGVLLKIGIVLLLAAVIVLIVFLLRRNFGPQKNKAKAFANRVRKTAKKEKQKTRNKTTRSPGGTTKNPRRGSGAGRESGDYHVGQPHPDQRSSGGKNASGTTKRARGNGGKKRR